MPLFDLDLYSDCKMQVDDCVASLCGFVPNLGLVRGWFEFSLGLVRVL